MIQKIKEIEFKLKSSVGKEKVNLLNDLSYSHFSSNPQKGEKIATEALKLSQKINYLKGIANSYLNLGNVNLILRRIDKSLNFAQKSNEIFSKFENQEGIEGSFLLLGNISVDKGNYSEGLEYFFKVAKIKELNNDTLGLARIHINIGTVLVEQGLNSKALDYYLESSKLLEELKAEPELAVCYLNIGNIYNRLGEGKKALEYYFQSEKISQKKGDKLVLATVYQNIGVIHLDKKDFKKSQGFFQKSLTIREEIEDLDGIAECYINLGLINVGNENLDLAKDYFEKGLELSQKICAKNKIAEFSKKLADIYERKSEFSTSISYYKKYIELKKEILNTESTKQIAEMQTKYETEKKERENEIYKLKNVELAKKNKLILSQKDELNKTYEKLKKLNHFKENLTEMIIHDLKNPLNSVIGLSDSETTERNFRLINQSGRQMLNLVMNMLEVQKFEDSKIKLNLKNAAIYETVENALISVNLLIEMKNLEVQNLVNQGIFGLIDTELIERVFVNLLTNAIKFSRKNEQIFIDCKQENGSLRISVTDKGSGIPEEQIPIIFEKYGQAKAENLGKIRSTGLGLTFCKLVVEAHKGIIEVVSKLNESTTFWFTLPSGQQIGELQNKFQKSEIKHQLLLTESDKVELAFAYRKLKRLEVYQASDLRKLLNKIDEKNNSRIKEWKSNLQTAIFSCNEEKFNELVSLLGEK